MAYVSFARIALEAGVDAQKPTVAPDLAVEVLSPGDRLTGVEEKVQLYFAYGVRCVVVADPRDRSLRVYADEGRPATVYSVPQSAPLFEDLELDLAFIYAPLK